ncbi:phospholipid-transporting ATPase [Chloropicon primus]|uniref:Phospholipid-transporting ATPase n=1 Tax=Chloropicon primus TaxID=1764295 RepID=A0A5B8MRD2_9CHLO|nr:phospholipid-transporting ATPase [Chloropicon primus]|eukprot:QDZ23003.1 phospholipid-transporting ATPase [Chloropicon primus]
MGAERRRAGSSQLKPGQMSALLSQTSGAAGNVSSEEVRTVFTNSSDHLWRKQMRNNRTRTAKYTIITFFPRSLYEQFRRVANVYFTLVAGLSLTDVSPVRPWTTFTPLAIVLGVSLVKEAIEDYKRHQADKKENGRQVDVWCKDKVGWKTVRWDQVKVGDVVRVTRDQGFPADIVLLSSGTSDGVCYVETMNLDGETNLKLKKAIGATNGMDTSNFDGFNTAVQCDLPNPSLYTFTGNIHLLGQPPQRRGSEDQSARSRAGSASSVGSRGRSGSGASVEGSEQLPRTRSKVNYEIKTYPVSPESILLRGSNLRNTEVVYGVVVYTGHESKVMMNATEPPSKRSSLEKSIDSVIMFQFTLLFFMCVSGSVLSGFWHEYYGYQHWYLALDDKPKEFTPEDKIKVMGLSFITSFILYGYLIPISLYVCVEMVKIVQAMIYIRCDREMYHEETDTAALARTSNLNEELGMIDTVLTDKTGTLTCNVMEFFKCSINGKTYGTGVNEIEKANSLRKGLTIDQIMEGSNQRTSEPVKGFSFYDEEVSDFAWTGHKDVKEIQMFLQLLAVCHTVVPEGEADDINYQAESPDEEALVLAAKEMGYKCVKRNLNSLFVQERDLGGEIKEKEYKILHVLEFTSARKRQSVIFKTPEGEIILGCKGADNVIYDRLAERTGEVQENTQDHLNAYAQAGLRTLCISYRKLSDEVYSEFHKKWTEAKTALSDRDVKVEAVNDKIERELILVGATAIEDRLQDKVPQCLELLANAGLRIWMLTGDKLETAVNIGYACSLLTDSMSVHTVQLNLGDTRLSVDSTHEERSKVFTLQVTEQFAKISKRVMKGTDLHALVIEGNALAYAITPENADSLIDICGSCASVICCRVSPRQKAQVTELVKLSGATTLAIGDGANDVGMIQAAHIGVGISGKEGMQAVMSSDFAIAQFKFLERLVLLHGRISYKRLGRMVGYFFYKNIVLGLCLYFYNSQAFFSGQTLFDDFYLSCYNILFTSLPVLAVGVFDEDVKYKTVRKYPRVYEQGALRNEYFSFFPVRTMWVLNAVYAAIVNFLFVLCSYGMDADKENGKVSGLFSMGTCLYTTIVITVNIQIALVLDHWTIFHHFAIWGSILCWFLFLIVYGSFDPDISQNVYQLFLTIVVPTTRYWLIIVIVPLVAVLPDFFVRQLKHFKFPSDHRVLQEVEVYHLRGDMDRQQNVDLRNSRLSSLTLPSKGASKIRIKSLMSRRVSEVPQATAAAPSSSVASSSSQESLVVVQNPAALPGASEIIEKVVTPVGGGSH